jgi:hypothetical protein
MTSAESSDFQSFAFNFLSRGEVCLFSNPKKVDQLVTRSPSLFAKRSVWDGCFISSRG